MQQWEARRLWYSSRNECARTLQSISLKQYQSQLDSAHTVAKTCGAYSAKQLHKGAMQPDLQRELANEFKVSEKGLESVKAIGFSCRSSCLREKVWSPDTFSQNNRMTIGTSSGLQEGSIAISSLSFLSCACWKKFAINPILFLKSPTHQRVITLP